MMKIRTILIFLAVPVFLLTALDGPSILVKIPKGGPDFRETLVEGRITVIQELESCVLAVVSRSDLRFIRDRGLAAAVLDHDVRGREYVLLAAEAALQAGLESQGTLISVEDATVLFRPDSMSAHDILPPGLARKYLSASPIPDYPERSDPDIPPADRAFHMDETAARVSQNVSRDRLSTHVRDLQDFQTRYAPTPQCAAAGESIFAHFSALGLRTDSRPFTFLGHVSHNIVAEKPGQSFPEDILIICGHYDSTSKNPQVFAPGADDNASGTAAVMEAARVLSAVPLDFTVRFIAFSAEELGLFGSRAYAAEARAAGENIIGVVNLDMIAYADAMPEDLVVIANPRSLWLAERFDLAARAYTGLAVRKVVNASLVYSDHSPFWDMGYSAVLAIEDEPIRNPHYHKETDVLETLNFDFYEAAARTVTGLLAELAQPVRPGLPAPPRGLAARVFTYGSLFNAVRNTRLTWEPSPGAASYNVYRTTASRLGYKRLNSGPVFDSAYIDAHIPADMAFYYVVAAVGPDGREGNFSREIRALPYAVSAVSFVLHGAGGLIPGARP